MSGFDLPYRLLPETKQAISRGLDHIEEVGQATWTKLQRGLVEAGTAAMNAVAMSGATSAGFSPAAAMYEPARGQDVGEAVGAGEAFSPEALEREDNLGLGESIVTDLVAGIPTAFAGPAGEAADIASARAEAERSGMGPMGQAATTLLAAAPILGAGTAKKLVREIGGGTAAAAQAEFKAALHEAGTVRPPTHSLPEAGGVSKPGMTDDIEDTVDDVVTGKALAESVRGAPGADILKGLDDSDLERLLGVGVLPHETLPNVAGTPDRITFKTDDAFDLDRAIRRDPNGTLVAVHGKIDLPPSARGQGLAKRYLRDAVKTYEKLGVETIEIPQATGDGPVVWAKLGATGGDPYVLKAAGEAGLPNGSLEELARAKGGPRFMQKLADQEPRLFSELTLSVADLKKRLGPQ